MPFVAPHKVGDLEVPNVFTKVATAADSAGFSNQLAGFRQTVPVSEAETVNSTTLRFTLDFNYLVGANQLMVLWPREASSSTLFSGMGLIPSYDTALGIPGFNETTMPHYLEESSNTVIFKNLANLTPGGSASANGALVFLVPHTASPASKLSRVIVSDQGDNVGIELQGPGDGILLKTPEGRSVLVQADSHGNLITKLVQ